MKTHTYCQLDFHSTSAAEILIPVNDDVSTEVVALLAAASKRCCAAAEEEAKALTALRFASVCTELRPLSLSSCAVFRCDCCYFRGSFTDFSAPYTLV